MTPGAASRPRSSGSGWPPGLLAARRALGDPRTVPSIDWIVRLTGAAAPEVREVLAEVGDLVPLERAIRASHRTEGGSRRAQIRAPFELYALARLLRPAAIVECGVSSGVSSAHFLAALRKNRHGHLHSIDLPRPQRGAVLGAREPSTTLPPGRSSGWSVPGALRPGWDLRLGPSETLLPALVAELPAVDLFLHDDRHTPRHLATELSTIAPKLHVGSVVLADNTAWTGTAFPRFAARLGTRLARRRRSDLVGLRVPAGAGRGRRSPAPGPRSYHRPRP